MCRWNCLYFNLSLKFFMLQSLDMAYGCNLGTWWCTKIGEEVALLSFHSSPWWHIFLYFGKLSIGWWGMPSCCWTWGNVDSRTYYWFWFFVSARFWTIQLRWILLKTNDKGWLLYNSDTKEARNVPISINIHHRIIKYNESLVSIIGSKQVDGNAHEDNSYEACLMLTLSVIVFVLASAFTMN